MKKEIAKNTFINISADLLLKASGFILLPFILFRIGPYNYGIYALAASLVENTNIFEFGIGAYIAKRIAELSSHENYEDVDKIFTSSFVLNMLFVLILSSMLLIFILTLFVKVFKIDMHYQEASMILAVMVVISFVLIGVSSSFRRALQGYQDFYSLRSIDVYGGFFSIFSTLMLLWYFPMVITLGVVLISTSFVDLLLAWYFCKNRLPFKIKLRISNFNLKIVKDSFVYSFSLIFGKILALFADKIDIWLIGLFINPIAVAIYSVARKLYRISTMVFGYLCSTLLPVSAKLAIISKEKVKNLFINGAFYSYLLAFPINIFLIILSKPIIKLWVGDDYLGAVLVSQLLMTNISIWFMASFANNIYIGIDRYKYLIKYNVIAVLINFIISLYLVQKVGIFGPAIGTFVGGIISGVLYMREFISYFEINISEIIKRILLDPLLINVMWGGAIYIVLQHYEIKNLFSFLVFSGIAFALYAGILYKWGIKKEEKELLGDLFNEVKTRFASSFQQG